jgi:hypothetical protein
MLLALGALTAGSAALIPYHPGFVAAAVTFGGVSALALRDRMRGWRAQPRASRPPEAKRQP